VVAQGGTIYRLVQVVRATYDTGYTCYDIPNGNSAVTCSDYIRADFAYGWGLLPIGKVETYYYESFLRWASDFSAGAGDCLTGRCIPFVNTSLTEKIRQQNGDDSVVNKSGGTYTAGKVTGEVVGTSLLTAGGATIAALADGKYGAWFGRGGQAFFNRGPVRFGWSWEGSAKAGRDVIRLGIGAARGTSWWSHIPFYYP